MVQFPRWLVVMLAVPAVLELSKQLVNIQNSARRRSAPTPDPPTMVSDSVSVD
jgi:hypothetical protein